MEDVLYILIGVAWVAYSIYSRNQKVKKQQAAKQSVLQDKGDFNQAEEQTQSQPSAFEKIISEFQSYSGQETKSSPIYSSEEDTFVSEPEIKSVENISSIEETTEGNSPLSQEMIKHYLTNDNISDKDEFTDDYNEMETEAEIEFDFDLRKAIIYSEILKRPEY